MKDWFSPGQIHFQREEMIWLIVWLGELGSGHWPPEHKETGYTGYQKSRTHRAPFEIPVQFAAEVSYRLKTTGEAGEALVDEIQGGITDFEGLSGPAKRALNYISGFRRRQMSYKSWVRQRKYRARILDKPTPNQLL